MKQKTLWLINILLTAIIGWFASCAVNKKANATSSDSHLEEIAKEDARGRIRVKYGVPNARYHLYGNIKDQKKHPVSHATVTIKGYKNREIATTTTTACGKYRIDAEGWPTDSLNIVVSSEEWQTSDSVKIKAEYVETGGWTREGKEQRINIQLKNK